MVDIYLIAEGESQIVICLSKRGSKITEKYEMKSSCNKYPSN